MKKVVCAMCLVGDYFSIDEPYLQTENLSAMPSDSDFIDDDEDRESIIIERKTLVTRQGEVNVVTVNMNFVEMQAYVDNGDVRLALQALAERLIRDLLVREQTGHVNRANKPTTYQMRMYSLASILEMFENFERINLNEVHYGSNVYSFYSGLVSSEDVDDDELTEAMAFNY
jgi:hypothetical protein